MSSSERTPLLGSTGGNSDRSSVYGPSGIRHGRSQLVEDTDDETPSDIESVQTSTQKSHAATTSPTKRIIRGLLCYVLLCLGILALLVLAGSHLIAGRLLSDIIERPDGLQDLAEKSLVLEGPNGAQVLGWDQDSVKVALTGRAGVNVYAGLEEELRQHGFVSGMQKTMLRWGVRQADKVSIDSQEIHILAPHRSSHFPLLTITIQDPVTLPLRYSPLAPRDDKQLEWLDDVRLSLRIQLHAPADIVKLALDSWENEQLQFIAKAPKIRVSFTGRLLRFMGRLAIFKMDNLSEVVSLQGQFCFAEQRYQTAD